MTAEAPSMDLATLDAGLARGGVWHSVCSLADLESNWGEAALVGGLQIALFRLATDEVYAVEQRDPATGAHVMARGIVGSRGSRPTIASPLHKQVYDLATGERLDAPGAPIRAFAVRVVDGTVQVAGRPAPA